MSMSSSLSLTPSSAGSSSLKKLICTPSSMEDGRLTLSTIGPSVGVWFLREPLLADSRVDSSFTRTSSARLTKDRGMPASFATCIPKL